MLSSAPNIAGCGELTLGGDLSHEFTKGRKKFGVKEATEFAQEFRKLMPPIPESSVAFVDKMPHNYQRVGFLLSAFPNAKVINMLRDPRMSACPNGSDASRRVGCAMRRTSRR